jgi:hypothetical protein
MGNILKANDLSSKKVFGDEFSVLKKDCYNWATISEPGEFRLIDKYDLKIDGDYQREPTSKARILEIAKNFDWKLFGAISVIERTDKTLWVFEGGHRTRACFYRDDVKLVPCMVFKDVNKLEDEAKAFIGSNKLKSSVNSYDYFKASVVAKEPISMKVENILDRYGYKISRNGGPFSFSAIATFRNLVYRNEKLAEKVFGFWANMAGGSQISASVLRGLFVLTAKLEGKINVIDSDNSKRFIEYGITGCETIILRKKIETSKGGELVEAIALLDILNKRRRQKYTIK